MIASWEIDLDGSTHSITVERSEAGKDVIRIDGRIGAKPLGPEEEERFITVAGYSYVVRRVDDSFELDVADAQAAHESNMHIGATILASSKAAPLSAQKSSGLIGKLIVWGGIVGAVALLMVMLQPPSYEKVARARVHHILDEMKSGRGVEMQFAICLWQRNVKVLDNNEMSYASDNFDKWRREKDLYNKGFTKFEIVSSKVLKGESVPTAIIGFSLDGVAYTVRVPDKQPISWE
jgi:hypothetical protein